MKKTIFLLVAAVSFPAMAADQYVQGYMKRDGTYVAPHHRTAPDHNPYNNYSTQGNANPYTGKSGSRDAWDVQRDYSNNSIGGGNNNLNPYGNPFGQQRRGW
jgi:hypothetical protein